MRKTLTYHDGNGNKFEGVVVVSASTRQVTVHNRSTHDDEVKTERYWIITGIARSRKLFEREAAVTNLASVLETAEKDVMRELETNTMPTAFDTALDLLKRRGYE